MSKRVLFFICLLLLSPQVGFAFSESELDSLESSGKKSFSKSPWRTELGFGLQRNVDLNIFHKAGHEMQLDALAKDQQDSLLDLSILYYSLGLAVNYSLLEAAQKFKLNFLKNMELFSAGSFETPVTGYKSNLEKYNAWQYIHYALGDITFGFTTQIYQKDNFLAYFSSSSFIPSSKFSKEAGLFSGLSGNLNFLYFLKKQSSWSLAVSSGHALHYRHYTKSSRDRAKDKYEDVLRRNDTKKTGGDDRPSVPWSAQNSGSFIFKQTVYRDGPTRMSFRLGHTFGIDTEEARQHYLSLNAASSWKIRDRLYLNISIRWRDLIDTSNPKPEHADTAKSESIGWFDLKKYVFSLGGSYSF